MMRQETERGRASNGDPFAFAPDQARTLAMSKAVRSRFIESAEHVLVAAARLVSMPGDVSAWAARLEACKRVPPHVWGCYHDLVQAGMRDDLAAVERLSRELIASDISESPVGQVVTVAASDLGEQADRYMRLIDSDLDRPLHLVAVAPAETKRIAGLTAQARILLHETCPPLLDEMDTLAHQIVLATSVGPRTFGGAASIFLWGAVVLNPTRVLDRIALVESLAHETAHALLFGLTLGADLTTNDAAERYTSPLRPDPRPMEGIVHATYVLARMTFAIERLRASMRLTRAEQESIEAKLARNRASFKAGLATVDQHASFTADGMAIFDGCRQAMSSRQLLGG